MLFVVEIESDLFGFSFAMLWGFYFGTCLIWERERVCVYDASMNKYYMCMEQLACSGDKLTHSAKFATVI